MAVDSNNPGVYVDKKPLTPEDIGKTIQKIGFTPGTLARWYENQSPCVKHLQNGVVVLHDGRHHYACCCSFLS